MAKIQVVVFDMDGVLIDAKEWHYEAFNRAIEHFGYSISREEHLTTYDGMPTKQKLALLTEHKGLPRGLHAKIEQLKQQFTLELAQEHCKPHAGHHQLLARLKRRGLLVAVASNSIRKTIDRLMQLADLQKYLDFSLSNQDVSRPKPDPEIYLMAASAAGVLPQECLVIEDNHYGVEAATAAGAHVLQVHSVDQVNSELVEGYLDRCAADDIARRNRLLMRQPASVAAAEAVALRAA